MTTRKLDTFLDYCLWALFILLGIGGYFLCDSIKAPEFEPVETSVQIPYVYSSADGEKYDSYYQLAWKHEAFSSPTVAAYDPKNGSNATFKDEYIEEYKAVMPESQYPFYTRWTWAILAVLVIAAAFFSYWVGGFIRDLILYITLKFNNRFADCAYFLYESRVAFKGQVRQLVRKNIGIYINTKSQELFRKYNPGFASLLVYFLKQVQVSGDTDIVYYLTYSNLTTDHKSYLGRLRSYWDGQIGKSADAEKNVRVLNEMINGTYLSINLLLNEEDIVNSVNNQLNHLFEKILGGKVLKFSGANSSYAKARKMPNRIFIDINVRNHTNTFTWSGSAVPSGTSIPGIQIEFKIFHYLNGTEQVLWNKYLTPVCTYTAKDEEFASSELYKRMVNETINSFENNGKS